MTRFGHKVGHIDPKWAKSGDFFQIRFSIFWLGEPKCTESDLKKIPRFVPFGANLTHFGPEPEIDVSVPVVGSQTRLRAEQNGGMPPSVTRHSETMAKIAVCLVQVVFQPTLTNLRHKKLSKLCKNTHNHTKRLLHCWFQLEKTVWVIFRQVWELNCLKDKVIVSDVQ